MCDPAITTNADDEAAQFLRESGELQRITVRCLVVALRRQLDIGGLIVGAVWSESHRRIRCRAVWPSRLARRGRFQLTMMLRLQIEGINPHWYIRNLDLRQHGAYLDFSCEVEAG
jgi:hypothetical protein